MKTTLKMITLFCITALLMASVSCVGQEQTENIFD